VTALLLAAMLSGPIPCDVVRVLDGDTLEAPCVAWIGTEVKTMIRVRGVDTPEKAPRAKCPGEAALAIKATKLTKDALPPGTHVYISKIENDKYGGRVVADVVYDTPLVTGVWLSRQLIDAGLARSYDGGTKSSWCLDSKEN
jgi:endonuclease YncB( thermonuclease family)